VHGPRSGAASSCQPGAAAVRSTQAGAPTFSRWLLESPTWRASCAGAGGSGSAAGACCSRLPQQEPAAGPSLARAQMRCLGHPRPRLHQAWPGGCGCGCGCGCSCAWTTRTLVTLLPQHAMSCRSRHPGPCPRLGSSASGSSGPQQARLTSGALQERMPSLCLGDWLKGVICGARRARARQHHGANFCSICHSNAVAFAAVLSPAGPSGPSASESAPPQGPAWPPDPCSSAGPRGRGTDSRAATSCCRPGWGRHRQRWGWPGLQRPRWGWPGWGCQRRGLG
jgi:hypothetical protein